MKRSEKWIFGMWVTISVQKNDFKKNKKKSNKSLIDSILI